MARWCSALRSRAGSILRRDRSAGWPGHIEAVIAQQENALDRLSARIERQFIQIGETLPAQAALAQTLAHHGARLVTLSGGEGPATDPAAQAVAFANRTLASIAACSRERRELLECLGTYQARTARLLDEESQVGRILAPLRVIQTFFRIESARLPAEMQSGFHALSSEIPKFEQQVRETFGRHAASLSDTCRHIEAARQQMHTDGEAQERTLQEDRSRLQRTLQDCAAGAHQLRERHQRLAELVNGVDREARQLVVSLQYQDITRQKMEHIRAALAGLRQPAGSGVARRGSREHCGDVCALEAAQCDAVRADLDRALGTIDRGARTIRDHLAGIAADGWSRDRFPAALAAAAQRVAAIETALDGIQALAPAALAGTEQALAVIGSFETVAADVATTARDMAESMRLIALNAQVLAAQAGDAGAGLLVLAERTYEISEEIRRVTEAISREFADASAALATVLAQRDRMEAHARDCRDAFETEGVTVREALARGREETVSAITAIADGLEQFARHHATITAALADRAGLLESLGKVRGDLAALAPRAGASSRPTDRPAAAHLAQRYTMASEREVHAAVCGAAAVVDAASAPAASAPGLGDNVELF
jgi:hypothetical protein